MPDAPPVLVAGYGGEAMSHYVTAQISKCHALMSGTY